MSRLSPFEVVARCAVFTMRIPYALFSTAESSESQRDGLTPQPQRLPAGITGPGPIRAHRRHRYLHRSTQVRLQGRAAGTGATMGLRRRPRPTDGAPGLAQACVLGRWATRSRRVVHESAACSARGCANARNAIERTCEFECEARACQAPGKQAAQRGGRAHGCAIARNEHVADDDPSAVRG